MCHRLISLCSEESGEQKGSILHKDLTKGLIEPGRPGQGAWAGGLQGVWTVGLDRGSGQGV